MKDRYATGIVVYNYIKTTFHGKRKVQAWKCLFVVPSSKIDSRLDTINQTITVEDELHLHT